MSVTKQRKGGKKQLNIPSKLDEAEQAIRALKRTMDEEASVLLEERSTFEIMRKKLDGVHFKKHIKLNVGGQIFKTSIETLLKDPDSMLAAMFSERFDVKADEEDGAYFIDRDGTHFRYILNYLRTGKLVYPSENKVLHRELCLEAEFYQINGIRKELWFESAFENSNFIINSLTNEQRKALLSWLPDQYSFRNWRQLFCGATNGWSTPNFHQNCDNKGPTVVIARSGNNIFGGYAELSWSSTGSFVKDENAFLFTLANPTGARPTKLAQTDGNGGIWCHPSWGPSFGSASGVCIYFINSNGSSNCGMNNAYVSFAVPEGQAFYNFIYGNTTTFGMSHLEVFGLKEC